MRSRKAGNQELRHRDSLADAYRVQWSPERITDDSWRESGVVTYATTRQRRQPGHPCWSQIADLNRLGEGLRSEPAMRAVM